MINLIGQNLYSLFLIVCCEKLRHFSENVIPSRLHKYLIIKQLKNNTENILYRKRKIILTVDIV